jgi:hypothetical protein
MREIHLDRLRHLLRLRHQYERDLNLRGLRLLDHSIFAAYCDCRKDGTEGRAQEILREAHVPVDRPKVQLSFQDLAGEPSASASASREGSAKQAQPKG